MAGPRGHRALCARVLGRHLGLTGARLDWGGGGVCCEWRRQHWCLHLRCLQSLTIPQEQWGPLVQGLSPVTCE